MTLIEKQEMNSIELVTELINTGNEKRLSEMNLSLTRTESEMGEFKNVMDKSDKEALKKIRHYNKAVRFINKEIQERCEKLESGEHELTFEHDIYNVYFRGVVVNVESSGDSETPGVDETHVHTLELEIKIHDEK